jgi:hypothetical protein
MAIRNVAIIDRALTPTDISNAGWSTDGDGFLVNGGGEFINENGQLVDAQYAVVPSASTSYRHTLLSVPDNKAWAVTTIMICNSADPDGADSAEEFDMYIVPDGSTASFGTTVVVRKLSLPAGETFTFDSEKIILGEFDRIVIDGYSTGAENLVATVSYLEV